MNDEANTLPSPPTNVAIGEPIELVDDGEITELEHREIKRSAQRLLDHLGLTRSRVAKLCERYSGRCSECGRLKPGARETESHIERRGRPRLNRIPFQIV